MSIVKDVLKILTEKNKVGFCPIQMPTGSGKTHSVLKFIYDYITSHDEGRIIFITSMKKNLPEYSLKKIFKDKGKAELFEKNFLFLDSKEQTVCDNYDDSMKATINGVIADSELISDFVGLIKSIRNFKKSKKSKNNDDKKAESVLRERLRNSVEPQFRSKIRFGLNQFKGYDAKYDAVMNNPNWNWVSRLYPEVRSRDCRIIFMSADKFVMKNDTLVEKSYLIYDSELVKGSIIFIDEFDSTKKAILNREIEMSVNRNLDYMKVANQIYGRMNKMDKHPDEMYVLSKRMAAEEPDDLRKFGCSVQEEFNKVFDKFNLEYKFLMEMSQDASEFLFHGHTTHYISNEQIKYISVNYDGDQRINIIKSSDKKDDMYHFKEMFKDLNNVFRYFFSFVRKLALNCKFAQDAMGTPIGYEYCIRSVLEIFELDNDTTDYFTSEVLTMQSSKEKKAKAEDSSVYERGFSVYNLKNGTDHLYNSVIKMVSHNIMPEKILLKICSNALVFGVSATATLDTVTGNYDLNYIKSRLKENYIELDDEMKGRLRIQFDESISGYDGYIKVEICPISARTSGKEYDSDLWDTICSKEVNAEDIRNLLDRKDYNDFHKARYLRIAMVFHKFLLNQEVFSLLCFLNRHPIEESEELDRNTLKSILIRVSDGHKNNTPEGFNVEKSLFYLDGDNYDEKKDELLRRLSNKEKIFVITAYNTLGAGQNIQYPIESTEGFVRINKIPLITESKDGRPLEKDFDAIYLDFPRNIIPFATKNKKMKNIIEQIAITESLYEKGEITSSDEWECIKSAFTGSEFEINYCKKICRGTLSANNQAAGQIIQAVGRICRTSFKNPKIYIFVDEDVRTVFDKKPEYYGELLNYETEKLIEYLATSREDNKLHDRLADKGENRSLRAMGYINKIKRNEWSDESIKKWESLRQHVLEFPTTSDTSDDLAYQFYMEVPEGVRTYWYTTDDDFKTIRIKFDKNKLDNPESVSEESARLKELLQIPGIADLFKERRYATIFENHKFMLSPPLFKNIYKGALGEVIGERIIYDKCNTKLISLDVTEYETFDFKTEDSKFYFDFKNWNSSGFVDQNIYDEILRKMKKIGSKKVFIINILKPKSPCIKTVRPYEKDGLKIIEVPYLYDAEFNRWNEEAIFGINRELES